MPVPTSWGVAPAGASLTRFNLPAQLSAVYADRWSGVAATEQALGLRVLVSGVGSAVGVRSVTARGETMVRITLLVDTVYGCVLVDSTDDTSVEIRARRVYSEVDGDVILMLTPLPHRRYIVADLRAPARLAAVVSGRRTIYTQVAERSEDVT